MAGRVRNASAVLSSIGDVGPDKPVIAKKAITIQFPVRFKEIGLATIGATTQVYGLFAMILDTGEWALCNVNAKIELGSASIDIVKIDDRDYYSYRFEAGQVLFKTRKLVCQSSLIFSAVKEFVLQGKVPWYVGYEDMGKLFDTSKKHAHTSAVILPSVMEFLAAYCARNKSNRMKYYREGLKSKEDEKNLTWVPLESVYWSAPGTVNKLAGAYFQDGVVSAIVNPSDRVEKIETILRA